MGQAEWLRAAGRPRLAAAPHAHVTRREGAEPLARFIHFRESDVVVRGESECTLGIFQGLGPDCSVRL